MRSNTNFSVRNDSVYNNVTCLNSTILPLVEDSSKTQGNLCYEPKTKSLMLYSGYEGFINETIKNVVFINTSPTSIDPNIPNQFVVIDTSNESIFITLEDSNTPGNVIYFSLLSPASLSAVVNLTSNTGGSFVLDQTFYQKTLIYTQEMGWIPYLNDLNYDYYPSLLFGEKLVGTGGVAPTNQGTSCSISSDGKTIALGGYTLAGNSVGQTWIFVYSDSDGWKQQGNPLIGSNATGNSNQGYSVSLSSDGNTLAVGGPGDSVGVGAAWVFTRTNGIWSQQQKIIGAAPVGASQQGSSVSLSADGNTLAVGGQGDNVGIGATWVFTRAIGVWTEQQKIIGAGNTGASNQGSSVSLSADGNVLAIGGSGDNLLVGATWVFSRAAGVWTIRGAKIVGTVNVGTSQQGKSVSISSNGNLLAIGGPGDNANAGAVWTFNYSVAGNNYVQIANKITQVTGLFGTSVCLSSDGNTLLVGAPHDQTGIGMNKGSVWSFTKSLSSPWVYSSGPIVFAEILDAALIGYSCALSSYGNTGIVGAPANNTNVGTALVIH